MYLKSIEVHGFKSFANKIVFEFHNGITGFVGPNGSGKSNVADAVRWVLGEQKVKQLRSASMQDVIFAGTENRKPVSFAYVAITLDNSDHQLPLDYNEVTVARRVYRSGESEYLINGTQCRLKDVNELFYDTGIGKEGYSIIGQGQIDKILSGKPEERRELFDEAAGIVKFKRRKATALKKLEDEQQNLVRVNDILSELERQVGPLERQAEHAKIYLKKKEEVKDCDRNLFLLEMDRMNAELQELEQKCGITEHQQQETTQNFEKAKARYEELEENVAKAVELIKEILLNGKYDEANRINETVLQNDYMLKQSIIGSGHVFAITKSLSAFSKYGAMKELLDGESFVKWFSDYAADFEKNHDENCEKIANLTSKAFAKNRLFVGASIDDVSEIEKLIEALPENEIGEAAQIEKFDKNDCSIEIPADVGFSALGCNLYAIGDKFKGSCSVAASLMTFGFLWNAVRVQGGAYGTGMSIRANGDMFCYSYRDPNLENSKEAFCQTADFLEDFLSRNMPLDDIIIGTVNTTEPLLDPSGICDLACARFLKGTKPDSIAKIRGEILDSTNDDLKNLVGVLRKYIENGKLCAVGNPDAVAFAVKK